MVWKCSKKKVTWTKLAHKERISLYQWSFIWPIQYFLLLQRFLIFSYFHYTVACLSPPQRVSRIPLNSFKFSVVSQANYGKLEEIQRNSRHLCGGERLHAAHDFSDYFAYADTCMFSIPILTPSLRFKYNIAWLVRSKYRVYKKRFRKFHPIWVFQSI